MKRRNFLILSGMTLSATATLGIISFLQARRPDSPLPPTAAPIEGDLPAPANPAPAMPPTQPAPPVEAPLPSGGARPVNFLFLDEFSDERPAGLVAGSLATDGANIREVIADSANAAAITGGALHIAGLARVQNDPGIRAGAALAPSAGAAFGARFKASSRKPTGRLGVFAPDGAPIAAIHRTEREASGGIVECGGLAAPALTLYSGCWYDVVTYLGNGQAAVAVNDGAGLELVLVTDQPALPSASGGYSALGGQDQQVEVDRWYAIDALPFPPALVEEPAPGPGYRADLGANAAWVETRLTLIDGEAGLRIRSLDPNSEFRVTLDGRNLRVAQVINGGATLLMAQPAAARPGAKLAARYNELTLTVYLDGALVGQSNLKIGAPALAGATTAGTYSTSAANTFQNFIARPVRLEVPGILRPHLLDSQRVLCLGDSLTSADFALGYQNRLRKSLGDGWVTVDAGVSGQTTWQMASRLPVHLEHARPAVLVVMGGTNDVHNNSDARTIIANLQAIYSQAKTAGARVAAATIPPLKGYSAWTTEKQAVLERVNDWIRGEAQGVDYRIDAYRALEDPGTGALLPAYDGGDHLHLSGQGYARLADEILNGVAW